MAGINKSKMKDEGCVDQFREIRIRIKSSHPLFPEIVGLKHSEALELLSQLIMDGITWQRRVGPVFELLVSRSNALGDVDIPMPSLKAGKQKVNSGKARTDDFGITGDDVLKSFGIGQ